MSRVDALDAVVTSVGTKVGAGATAATATTNGEVNVNSTLIGLAQAAQGVVDFASKGLQASKAMWAKGVPLVGSGLGMAGLVDAYSGRGPQSQADYAGVVSNGATVLGGVAALYSFPVVATGLGVVAIGAGGYQIYQSAIDRNSPSSPLNTYNFGPNYRGKGFTDPRLLDNAGGYRGMNTYSGVYASKTTEYVGYMIDMNAVINAYSMQPGYSSLPTESQAYNGLDDEMGDEAYMESPLPRWQDFYDLDSMNKRGNSGDARNPVNTPDFNRPPSNGSNWSINGTFEAIGSAFTFFVSIVIAFPVVVDLDDDGVEIKPLDRSTTTFDFDNDGYKERTAWVGADDGLLIIDIGGDGQVTQSREMAFGEWTNEEDTDLQALAKVFDSNGDGTFDSRDARFAEFRIWKDANSNGVADAGEMMTMQAAGIASMATTVQEDTALDLSDGTSIAGLFKVQRTDGKLLDGADVRFAYQKAGVKETVDAQGNKVFTFEDGGVYKHMVMDSIQTDVTLPDASGIHWIGVTGNAANDALYRRCA